MDDSCQSSVAKGPWQLYVPENHIIVIASRSYFTIEKKRKKEKLNRRTHIMQRHESVSPSLWMYKSCFCWMRAFMDFWWCRYAISLNLIIFTEMGKRIKEPMFPPPPDVYFCQGGKSIWSKEKSGIRYTFCEYDTQLHRTSIITYVKYAWLAKIQHIMKGKSQWTDWCKRSIFNLVGANILSCFPGSGSALISKNKRKIADKDSWVKWH